MLDLIREMLSYPFLVRSMVVGILVSLCAALLGVSLVLKRYSMIGDGLSHVGFAALAIAMAFNLAPLSVAIPVVVVSAFFLLRISENSKIKGDAAIALLSTSALAVGVVVISLTTGMNTDVCNYLFGSILAMSVSDVRLSITFDENFARATGVKTELYNMLVAILTAVTIVLGMRMMGTLLITSLIIFPALYSMRLCKTFRSVLICASVMSLVCFLIGLGFSYVRATPTGASIVIVHIVVFGFFCLIDFVKGKVIR